MLYATLEKASDRARVAYNKSFGNNLCLFFLGSPDASPSRIWRRSVGLWRGIGLTKPTEKPWIEVGFQDDGIYPVR